MTTMTSMKPAISTAKTTAALHGTYMRMLDTSQRMGYDNESTIVESCIERMHLDYLEGYCDLREARSLMQRTIHAAKKCGIAIESMDALASIEALGLNI